MVPADQNKLGYQFIAHQIKTQINSGIYEHDDKLPSVRELALFYNANTKTIQRAIKSLESDGFIYTVPGLGTFVSKNIDHFKSDFEQSLLLELRDVVHKLRHASLEPDRIHKHFTLYLEEELPNENTI